MKQPQNVSTLKLKGILTFIYVQQFQGNMYISHSIFIPYYFEFLYDLNHMTP